jgi:heptosyltransferase-2
VRSLLVWDKRGADAGLPGVWRLCARLRAAHADDVAYFAQGSVRSAVVGLMAGYRARVGFDTSAGRWLYTQRVPYRRDQHHAQRLLGLAGVTVAPNEAPPRPRLYPGAGDDRAVDALLDGAGVAAEEPLVALAPGSVWVTKRWPYFPALAQRLPPDARVVVIGSSADRGLAQPIVDALGARAIDATGRLSLLASAALIGRARVLVTNDSAPLHMASAMNTPTVAVFGPTVPAFGFGPLADRRTVAEFGGLPCRPCHAHGPMRCPLGHFRCMRELTADHVLALVQSLSGS